MKAQLQIGIAILIFSTVSATAQSLQNVKTWKFALKHGSLQIRVERTSSGSVTLGLAPVGQTPEAPVVEQVQALKQVLAEMPRFGFDPAKLSSIGTHLYGEDATEKLAYACADSAAWRASVKNGARGKERLVVELLNQSGAYAAYNEAFRRYGIQVQVTEAEMVGMMPFSHVPARNARDRASAALLVPADVMIGMRFSRVGSNGAKD